jgi:hypothetical protein
LATVRGSIPNRRAAALRDFWRNRPNRLLHWGIFAGAYSLGQN